MDTRTIIEVLAGLLLVFAWANLVLFSREANSLKANLDVYDGLYSVKDFHPYSEWVAHFKRLKDAVLFIKVRPGYCVFNAKRDVIAECVIRTFSDYDKKGKLLGDSQKIFVVPVEPKVIEEYEEVKKIIAEVK